MDGVSQLPLSRLKAPSWRLYLNRLLAKEVSSSIRYFDRVVQLCARPEDDGLLLSFLKCAKKESYPGRAEFGFDYSTELKQRTAILLNGSLNHDLDIQETLTQIWPKVSRTARIFLVAYNPYWEFLYRALTWAGLRKGDAPTTFVTKTDLTHLSLLSHFEVVKIRNIGFYPWKLFGLGTLINSLFSALPGIRSFSLCTLIVLRPIEKKEILPSLTVVIPARNERGNIENALKRMPALGIPLEIIFVEGHSSDQTWEEIHRVQKKYEGQFKIQSFQQTGKGKADAVRLGFKYATHDLLTILDADLTMPPEKLTRFYNAWSSGKADFINGSRLVYPMEGEAMRFLNRLGNIFFAKALSFVLGVRLGDSLCGTKLFLKADYERFVRWRNDFGDFDPFGDFELLFPMAELSIGCVDIPVRYAARTYGSTNILRFRHGLMLLRMTVIGFFRCRMGKT